MQRGFAQRLSSSGLQNDESMTSGEAVNFESVLATCEAVTDGPANIFGEELMAYYPDAKVILNRRRDIEAWS